MTFRGNFSFLSNFYNALVTYRGLTYQNSEAAFQAQKCKCESDKTKFTTLTGAEAKSLGRKVKIRSDWEQIKLSIMEEVVEAKFTQHPELMQMLIDTDDLVIEEENAWNDTFWGVVNGKGQNNLGKILMNIRNKYSIR